MYNTWLTCILYRNIVSFYLRKKSQIQLVFKVSRNSYVDILQVITEQIVIDRIPLLELIFHQSLHRAKPN